MKKLLILGLKMAPVVRAFIVNVVFAVDFGNRGNEDIRISVVMPVYD